MFLLWLWLFIEDSSKTALNTPRSLQRIEIEETYQKPTVKAIKLYSQTDIDCLVQTIFFESRGTSTEAMQNVAYVVLNRTEAKGFPDTICGVVKQPKQFSYLNNFTPAPDWQARVLAKEGADKQALLKIKQVAKKVLKEGSKNKEVLWYATVDTKKNWMKNMKVQYNDGYHKHYAMK